MIVGTVLYPNEVDDAANCKERSEGVSSGHRTNYRHGKPQS